MRVSSRNLFLVLCKPGMALEPFALALSEEAEGEPDGVGDGRDAEDDAEPGPAVDSAEKKGQREVEPGDESVRDHEGSIVPRTSRPSCGARRTASSPSSRNVRVLPSGSSSGSVPFHVSSIRLPRAARPVPEIVPDASRSPVRRAAPFDVR